jgi:hypothetical protein
MSIKRVSPPVKVFDLLRRLVDAGTDGIPSHEAYRIMGDVQSLTRAAQWARSYGLPLVASRSGGDSRWWLMRSDSVRHSEWVTRILSDAYAELVRAHRALKPYPDLAGKVAKLQSAAVSVGGELGIPLSEIVDDLAPSTFDPDVERALVSAGLLPPGSTPPPPAVAV